MTHAEVRESEDTGPGRSRSSMARRRFLAAAGLPVALAGSGLLAENVSAAPARSSHTAIEADGDGIPLASLADLRAMTSAPAAEFYVLTDLGMEGLFRHDPADATSADNTGTVVVSAAGARFARVYSGAVNVRWFGARGDGIADDAPAIQAAIHTAKPHAGAVYLPAGAYAIGATLTLPTGDPQGLRIYGDIFLHGTPATGTTILPHSSITGEAPLEAIFAQADATTLRFLELEHLSIVGDKRANYGIYAPKIVNSVLFRVDVHTALLDGFAFGYGWYNRVENSRFFNNGRDGLHTIADQVNTFSLVNSQFLRNAHAGINIDQGGSGIRVTGCSIEESGCVGIMVQGRSRAVDISDCYFEHNLSTGPGVSFTNPDRLIRADILINGTTPDALGGDEPVGAVTLNNNYCFRGKGDIPDHFVACYASHTRLQITNTTFASHPSLASVRATILRTGTSQTGIGARVENLLVAGNGAAYELRDRLTVRNLDIDDLAGGHTELAHASIDGVVHTNYAPPLSEFTSVQSGRGAGVLRRGRPAYRRSPAAEIVTTRIGESDVFGFVLDLAEYPELAGRHVYFACYARASAIEAGPALWTSQLGDSTTGHAVDADWHLVSYVDQMPAAGSVSFGVRKLSAGDGSTVTIARPVLAEVGARYRDFAP